MHLISIYILSKDDPDTTLGPIHYGLYNVIVWIKYLLNVLNNNLKEVSLFQQKKVYLVFMRSDGQLADVNLKLDVDN